MCGRAGISNSLNLVGPQLAEDSLSEFYWLRQASSSIVAIHHPATKVCAFRQYSRHNQQSNDEQGTASSWHRTRYQGPESQHDTHRECHEHKLLVMDEDILPH